MSELKAINAYRLTTNTEDSDVYIHNDEFGCGGDLVECYLKSEADKVIVEKDKKIAELGDKLRHYPMMVALIESDNKTIAYVYAELRHHKHKRCVAMAKWCEIGAQFQHNIVMQFDNPFYIKRAEWLEKWHKRWLELAKHYKEAK